MIRRLVFCTMNDAWGISLSRCICFREGNSFSVAATQSSSSIFDPIGASSSFSQGNWGSYLNRFFIINPNRAQ